MLTIRPASADDASALVAFAARSFRDTFGPYNSAADMDAYVESAFTLAGQLEALADPSSLVLLAEDANGIAAYAQLRSSTAPAEVGDGAAIELERFYVGTPWQGRGLAHDLMARTIAAATERRARTVWLGVWERNARAIAFYARMGFERVGSKRFVLGSDVQNDLVMVRKLAAGS